MESPLDAVGLERGGEFEGRFHVLGGALSPVRGVLPIASFCADAGITQTRLEQSSKL